MNVIPTLLTAIERKTGVKPVPFSSNTIQVLPCISYQVYMQGYDAVTQSWRLQIRITSDSLEEAVGLQDAIASELVTFADESKFGALNIKINGGGTIEDENTHLPQLITFFDITTEI